MLTSTLTVCQRTEQFNLAPQGARVKRPAVQQWRSYRAKARWAGGTFTLRLVGNGAMGPHIVRGFCGATYYKARGQGLGATEALNAATYYTRGGSVWLLQLHGPDGKQAWQFASKHFARLFANAVSGQELQWVTKAPRTGPRKDAGKGPWPRKVAKAQHNAASN